MFARFTALAWAAALVAAQSTDPCATVRCSADTTCKDGKCVPNAPMTKCTPYTEAKQCTQGKDWCYNAATCECEFSRAPVQCLVNPCDNAKCELGFECQASYCGGCNHVCVKAKAAGCAAMLCAGNTKCVEDKQTGEGKCVDIVVADPCATVRCNADTTCKDGKCVPNAPTTKCTPYTEAKQCTQGKDWCYNAATCECEFSRAPVQCLVNPCDNAKCELGFECQASYCGGCNHVCVKAKAAGCAAMLCAGNTKCVEDKQTGEGKCVEQHPVDPLPPTQCKGDDDCSKDEFCRQQVGGKGVSPCLETKVCVKRAGLGATCGGLTLPCFQERCQKGLRCHTDDKLGIADAPGKCVEDVIVKPPTPSGCAAVVCIATMRCVEDKQTGEGKCVDIVVADPCAAVRCSADTTCKDGKCVPNAPTTKCTPYTEAKQCTQGKDWCYNAATCECEFSRAPAQCLVNPCDNAKCELGFECQASYCGGCNHVCVKAKAAGCAAMLCAGNTKCVEDKQTGEGKCVDIVVADPCATVRCSADTTCKDGKCVPNAPTTKCTPYTEAKQCTQGKDWCYNAATCECEFSRAPAQCLVNPCDTAKCEAGFECQASYCGGCNHVCVKAKANPCALVDCERDSTCVVDANGRGVCQKVPAPVCKEGSEWTEDCNTCFCKNGKASCTEKACEPGCESDDDCSKDEFCRQQVGGKGVSPCLEKKTCVKHAGIGATCGGRTLPCFQERCQEGLRCHTDGTDRPGKCVEDVIVKPPTPSGCAAVVCIATMRCVEDKQTGEGKCVDIVVADPCAAVRCSADTTCKDGKCVPNAPTTKCTPYTEAKQCTQGKDWCYNAATCECEFSRAPAQCLVNPCDNAKCELGFECQASYCGGCNHRCVKAKAAGCAAMLCAGNTKCVEDKQTGEGKCVDIVVADPCATVKCSADTTCKDGKCVPNAPTTKCTPYTAEQPCLALAGTCYNAKECKCGQYSQAKCKANPCDTAKCEAGFECQASYCGGCHHVCVKAKANPCALVDCERDSTCVVDANGRGVCQKVPAPVCKEGSEWTEDCNTCFCKNGKASCTEKACEPGCESDDDCSKDEFCRQQVGGKGVSPCLEKKTCVKHAGIGATCGGLTLPCFQERCQKGLRCHTDDKLGIADAPGKCVEDVIVKPPTPSGCAAVVCIATMRCVEDKQTGEGKCVDIVVADPCAAVKCSADTTCKDGKCVPNAPTTKCTPYTEAKQCTQGKDWCYNAATCECEFSRAPAQCLVNPCDTAKCEAGFECQASYCGGCNHVCVKAKANPCALVDCERDSTCVVDANGRGVCQKVPAPVCKEGSEWTEDCNTCFCKNGKASCTEKACEPGCESDDDCSKDEFCRQQVGGKGVSPCLEKKTCVKHAGIGATCGGFTLPCFQERCQKGLRCHTDDKIADAPGKCVEDVIVKPPTPSGCAAVVCIATMRCVEDKQTGEGKCVDIAVQPPKADDEKAVCIAALVRQTFTEKQRAECCRSFKIGCKRDRNCFSANGVLGGLQCCRDLDQGCPATCTATSCCAAKGVCTAAERDAEIKASEKKEQADQDKPQTRLRVTMAGDAAEVTRNPKKMLARARRTLLKASAALRRAPESLVVRMLSAAAGGWALSVPRTWNMELFAEERTLVFDDDAAVDARAGAVLQGDDEKVMVVFDILEQEEAARELEASVSKGQLATADGSAQTNAVERDALKVLSEKKGAAPEADTGSDGTVLPFAVAGVLGGLCLGGLVALTVYRRQSRKAEDLAFVQVAMEEYVLEGPATPSSGYASRM